MGRKKVREFMSKKYYEDMLEAYFTEHHDEVIESLMDTLGYTDFNKLQSDEHHMKWGFDCGWIKLIPKDKKMYHEWELDNGKYCAEIFAHPSYYPQSTTLQEIQVKKAVEDLNLQNIFSISVRLD